MLNIDNLLAKAQEPAREAMRLHPFYRGKIQMMPKCPVEGVGDFAVWYSPGVAAPCRAIHEHPELVYEHTNKGNSIAVVSDGSRVLGLGDIGPEAGLPVMEGKALLFKYLGGVDAVPLCLGTRDPDEFIRTVQLLEPSFGGINLEDIAQPKCFRILDTLRATMKIPVWHDDQQGTATVVLAGLLNALKVVGKDLRRVRMAMIGAGAAGIACYRLLKSAGVDPAGIIACDSQGTLHRGRSDVEKLRGEYADKWRVCEESNRDGIIGGIAEALREADVCIAFSKSDPALIKPEWIRTMAPKPIVFACANPLPEIWPWDAKAAGAAIVGTGRGDFANQVNNSLGFPAIFRGALDVRARTISDEMALAAADELARCAEEKGLSEECIVPSMGDWEIYPRVAIATALKAQERGLATHPLTNTQIQERAWNSIRQARAATAQLMKTGIIPPKPAVG